MKEVAGRNGGKLKSMEKGDKTINPNGRGAGILNSKTIIRKWLEAVEKAKNPISGQDESLTQLDIITLKQLEKARKGDTIAFRELLDRMEGKATNNMQLTGKDGKDLNTSPLVFVSAEKLSDEQIDKIMNKDAGDNDESI